MFFLKNDKNSLERAKSEVQKFLNVRVIVLVNFHIYSVEIVLLIFFFINYKVYFRK